MRQAGVLASAGLVALDNMIDRLADDHANARQLAHGLANIEGLILDPDTITTNIVIFDINPAFGMASDLITALKEEQMLVSSPGPNSIRMVTHRHISKEDVNQALKITSKAVASLKSNATA